MIRTMIHELWRSCVLLGSLTVLTGVVYPIAVTAVAQTVFPFRASGSLITGPKGVAGSKLIGQPFADPKNFWGRLSVTSRMPYDAAASSGSNAGPLNPVIAERVEARLAALRHEDPSVSRVPVDLVTASGSGLDPHISPAAAEVQVKRVAAARTMPEERVRELVREHTEPRQFGLFGEPRVNVLMLNLALDQERHARDSGGP